MNTWSSVYGVSATANMGKAKKALRSRVGYIFCMNKWLKEAEELVVNADTPPDMHFIPTLTFTYIPTTTQIGKKFMENGNTLR